MLADIVVFINSINKVLTSNGKKPKWIAFGCGYAGKIYKIVNMKQIIYNIFQSDDRLLIIGNLAAWLREKYPSYVSGAVVSSGPLQAQADFYRNFEPIFYIIMKIFALRLPVRCSAGS